jgi:hypothetical protein
VLLTGSNRDIHESRREAGNIALTIHVRSPGQDPAVTSKCCGMRSAACNVNVLKPSRQRGHVALPIVIPPPRYDRPVAASCQAVPESSLDLHVLETRRKCRHLTLTRVVPPERHYRSIAPKCKGMVRASCNRTNSIRHPRMIELCESPEAINDYSIPSIPHARPGSALCCRPSWQDSRSNGSTQFLGRETFTIGILAGDPGRRLDDDDRGHFPTPMLFNLAAEKPLLSWMISPPIITDRP